MQVEKVSYLERNAQSCSTDGKQEQKPSEASEETFQRCGAQSADSSGIFSPLLSGFPLAYLQSQLMCCSQ